MKDMRRIDLILVKFRKRLMRVVGCLECVEEWMRVMFGCATSKESEILTHILR